MLPLCILLSMGSACVDGVTGAIVAGWRTADLDGAGGGGAAAAGLGHAALTASANSISKPNSSSVSTGCLLTPLPLLLLLAPPLPPEADAIGCLTRSHLSAEAYEASTSSILILSFATSELAAQPRW